MLAGVSSSFVLELDNDAPSVPNLNQQLVIAYTLSDGNGLMGFPASILPAYVPAPDLQFGAHPPSGFHSGSFFDESRPGEGVVVQVVEVGDSVKVIAYWLTYGEDGESVWLAGSATVESNTAQVSLEMFGYRGGGFAGDFDPETSPSAQRWGSVRMSFPDCNRVQFAFASDHQDTRLPIGAGQRTWSRLANTNLLACE